MKVAIIDQDQSETSKKFVASLQQNDSLQLDAATIDDARDSVRLGKRVGMIVLPEGFGERAGLFWGEPPEVQVGVDPSRTAESAMLQGFIMQGIGGLIGERFQNPSQMMPSLKTAREQAAAGNMSDIQKSMLNGFFDSLEKMVGSADVLQTLDTGDAGNGGMQFANVTSLDVTRKIDPNSLSGQLKKIRSKWDVSFPQAMLWGILSCVLGFAISLARERSNGTLTRLQVAPISTNSILAGKAAACFITSLVVVIMMTAFGYALGMRPNSLIKLSAAAIATAAAMTGFMMVISVIGKTEQSVSGAGWAIMMVFAMLGGCMVPAMFLPDFMQSVSVVSPVKWGIQAIEGAVWRQYSWAEMATPLLVLLGFGAVLFTIGNLLLKRQLKL